MLPRNETAPAPRPGQRPAPNQTMAEQLASADDETFRKLVEEDMKLGLPDPMARALRDPAVVPRWYDTLVGLQKSVEGQLAARTADMRSLRASDPSGYKQEFPKVESWKANALRFKTGVDQALLEARRLLRDANAEYFATRITTERNDAIIRVHALETAIRKFQTYCETSDEISDDALDELFAVLPFES